ncbi:UNVERIFIED_CONTAM: hypothetical protein PYX00_011297 [Menopon gallinae]|uniref:RING-type domain-containing protein n=1 Tax=Menopon gallinae TaxID=328185 RepID=A0AAW2H796_9NEOP
MYLRCNNIKCRQEIQKLTLITQCSHIFCYQCYPKIKKTKTCIACRSYCDENGYAVKELDTKPCLAGYSPEEVFECAQKALSFWMYQNDQEFVIQSALREKAEESEFKAKHESKSLQANFSVEIESRDQKIERLEHALERERQNTYDLNVVLSEKTRQYQKLLSAIDRNKFSAYKLSGCRVAESNFKEQWEEHFRDLTTDIGECARSLELVGPDCTSIAAGDVRALDAERPALRSFILSSGECTKLTYGGTRYVFVRKQEDRMLPKPFFILVSLECVLGSGKRGMLATDYYDMVLIATFDNDRLANSVNAIINAPPDRDKAAMEHNELVVENKSKALALETPDGRILTKELLENFVDSSEEDDSGEKSSGMQEDTGKQDVGHGEAEEEVHAAVAPQHEEEVGRTAGEEDGGAVATEPPCAEEAPADTKKHGEPTIYVPPSFLSKNETVEEKVDVVAPRRDTRVYSIKDILECTRRKKVDLKYDKSIFSKQGAARPAAKLEPKKYDAVSMFRLELNRAAKSTIEGVLSSIRNLKVNTEDEMVEMARILFDKAVTETSYLIIYVYIIKDLYKTFQCEDEKKSSPKNTVFFTTLCRLCKETFKNRESWAEVVEERNLRNMTREERIQYEDECEEREAVRLKKKGRILGCIRLLGSLYCQSIISDTFVLVVLRDLMKRLSSTENIEIMCVLLECCGEKLERRHERELEEALKGLRSVSTAMDKRTKFLVMDFFDNVVPRWKKAATQHAAGSNPFYGMTVEQDDNAEAAPEQNMHVLIKSLVEDVLSIECSRTALQESVDSLVSRFSAAEFVGAYLGNVVENFGNVQAKMHAFGEFGRSFDENTIIQVLVEIQDGLEDLCCDAPYAAANFYRMLCYLRADGLVSKKALHELGDGGFEVEKRKVIAEWLEDYANAVKVNKVAEDEEVREILRELGMRSKYQKYIEKYCARQ